MRLLFASLLVVLAVTVFTQISLSEKSDVPTTEQALELPTSFEELEHKVMTHLGFSEYDAFANHMESLSEEEIDTIIIEALGLESAKDVQNLFASLNTEEFDYQPARFKVKGNQAFMVGAIDETTPEQVKKLIQKNPEVTTIVMSNVEGSVDDEANVVAARLVRQHGYKTHVPANGVIASGGVDFFLAGFERTIEESAQLGVHPWSGDGIIGVEVPKDDPQHQLYLKYYEEMGIPSDFYWFTLESAPTESIHWMTVEEIQRYELITSQVEITSEQNSGNISVIDIMAIPDSFPRKIKNAFNRYTQVIAPNGKAINIFAQTDITNAQILHARDVLVFYLTDVPNSTYGADKSVVANQMANNKATLMLLGGSDGDREPPRLNAQPLYATELIVEGTDAYINNDYENHRDATFEEILHLVHDTGIGVDFRGALQGVLPNYQAQIRTATTNALPENKALWASKPEVSGWLEEIRQEGSLTQEYLASVIDSYYGLWGAFEEVDGGMWGFYVAKTRADIETKDPMGLYSCVTVF